MGFREHTPLTKITSVPSSLSSTVLIDKNENRKGFVIFNDSTADLYLSLSESSSTQLYTAKLNAEDYWETPYGYSGIASGVWSAVNGNALVTEIL